MIELPVVDDYRRLFLDDVPLLDVRAPVEFAEGAFPHTENHPLITDAERHEIGIRYKDLGQDAAIDLGHELVRGRTRAERIAAWHHFARQHPGAVLYCFRGGMRSKISQRWLHEVAGLQIPRVKGGYKALRRYLIGVLSNAAAEVRAIRLGGRTGVGKTLLIRQLPGAIDLEGLAWHRGSAFGRHATPQPTQISFENHLAIALLKHGAGGYRRLIIEDEGRAIGSVHIPNALHDTFGRSPLVVLEATLEERIANTHREYVHEALAEYRQASGSEDGFEAWAAYLLDSIDRIRKRLGGARHGELRRMMETAISAHRAHGETEQHRHWIERLLVDYYDPMYDYQIGRNAKNVVFTGDACAVREYLAAAVT